MATTGLAFSPLLNVNGGRFDVLHVFDPSSGKYVDGIDIIGRLPGLEDQIEADEAKLQALEDRVTALESKFEALDQKEAPLFVAVEPHTSQNRCLSKSYSHQTGCI